MLFPGTRKLILCTIPQNALSGTYIASNLAEPKAARGGIDLSSLQWFSI